MIRKDPRFLDDIARMAGSAAGLMASMRQQFSQDIKARIESVVDRLDLPTRAEIEHLEAQIRALRNEVASVKGKGSKTSKTAFSLKPKRKKKKARA